MPAVPRRPKQHQLEDRSRTSFQSRLPSQWVWRDKDKDYGIDGEVEIFDEKGNATGLLFLVQLKATGSIERNTQRRIRLKRDTISYYRRLTAPVMLVRWVAPTNDVFFRWSDRLVTMRERTGSGDSITVRFDDSDIWCKDTPSAIERHLFIDRQLRGPLTKPVPILLRNSPAKVGSFDGHVAMTRVRARLGDCDLPFVVRRDLSRSVLEVVLTKHLILVFGGTRRLASFGGLAEIPSEYQRDHIGDLVLMSVGFALFHAGHISLAAETLTHVNEQALTLITEGAVHSAQILAVAGYYREAVSIARALQSDDRGEAVAQMTHFAIQNQASRSDDKLGLQQVEEYLRDDIRRFADSDTEAAKGTGHYNLANFLRARGRIRESLSEYRRSLRTWSEYGKRSYFWAEVGGVLFLLGRFRYSAKAYRKSLRMGSEPTICGRCADALMAAGKYAKALEEFGRYRESVSVAADEWVLKQYLVDIIVNSFEVSEQVRDPKGVEKKAIDELDNAASLLSANEFDYLSLDALNPVPWQIISERGNSESNGNARAIGDLGAALLAHPPSTGLWIRAFVSCATSEAVIGAVPNIVRYAYWLMGESFLADLFDAIGQFSGSDRLSELEAYCNRVLEEGERSPPDDVQDGLIYRMQDTNGSWRAFRPPRIASA